MMINWPEYVPDLEAKHILRRGEESSKFRRTLLGWIVEVFDGDGIDFVKRRFERLGGGGLLFSYFIQGSAEQEQCARLWNSVMEEEFGYTETVEGKWAP